MIYIPNIRSISNIGVGRDPDPSLGQDQTVAVGANGTRHLRALYEWLPAVSRSMAGPALQPRRGPHKEGYAEY